VFLITGVSGSGKTWIANQLNLVKFNVVDSDKVKRRNIPRLCISSKPTTLFLTIGASTFMKNNPQFDYRFVIVLESREEVFARITARGGHIDNLDKRLNRMNILAQKASFVGTSTEVLNYLLSD